MGPMMKKMEAYSVVNTQAQFLNGDSAPPAPRTIRSLLEVAHQQVEVLQQEIERLGGMLYPIRLSVPTGIGQHAAADQNGDPELIAILQALIDRLASQQASVRNICEEVRI